MKKRLVLFFVTFLLLECAVFAYETATPLLMRDGRDVRWGQGKNDDDGCSPSFNYLCPENKRENNSCDHMLAGCGAVAMAQIMYKWAYPNVSKYGSYDWNKIPPVLTDGCSLDCPRLIRDCGESCNMHYQSVIGIEFPFITGSWAVISRISDGFADFGYSAHVVDLDDWRNGSAWADLIRSEIDCGRPVLMYGKHNVVEISEKHYFVIDGYSSEDENKFHVNWGWRGSKNGYYDLENCGYSNGQKIVVGISPQLSEEEREITFSQETELLTPICQDGVNDFLRFRVSNADSYECRIYTRTGKHLWSSAGLVKDGYADVWDGSSVETLSTDDYWFEVVFKNSKGGFVEYSGHVTYFAAQCSDPVLTEVESVAENSRHTVCLYNQKGGSLLVADSENEIIEVGVLDMNARKVRSNSPHSNICTINIDGLTQGMYLVRVITSQGVHVEHVFMK